jgi:hypothetical protein
MIKSPSTQLQERVTFLKEFAKQTLAYEKLDSEDRIRTEIALGLIKKIKLDKLTDRECAMLSDLMWAAFTIGNSGGVSKSARLYFASESQRQRGRKSGEARKTAKWHDHAKELALQIRKENPKSSQDSVASMIEERWKLETPSSHRHIELLRIS